MSNIEGKLRIAYGHITHHGEAVAHDEEKSHLDKASNFSGLTVIVGRAPHSRWLKRIVGYHRKVQTTQPTNSVQEPHPNNSNKESSQVMTLPYKSKVHILHRRRRTWQQRIEPSRRRWSWLTHTRAVSAPSIVTTLQGLLQTTSIDDYAGHPCWNQHD